MGIQVPPPPFRDKHGWADRIPDVERLDIVIEYAAGLSIREIAVGRQRSYSGIRRVLVEARVPMRKRGGNYETGKRERFAAMNEASTGHVRAHLREVLGAGPVDGVGGEPKTGGGAGLVIWTSPGFAGVITTVRRSDHTVDRWTREFREELVAALEQIPGSRAEPVTRQDRVTFYWPGVAGS